MPPRLRQIAFEGFHSILREIIFGIKPKIPSLK